jgi:uncharacterized membrane protein YbhN (UPF0104 family)
MSMLAANLACLGLMLLDLAARTWRIQWLLLGTRCDISFVDALAMNAVGDAVAAATPNRIGGEPSRLGGMVLSGVPAAAGVVAIGVETLAMWPVNIAVGLGLALAYAPEWWRAAEPALAHTLHRSWPWVVAMLAAGGAAWWAVRRYAPALSHVMRRGTKRAWVYARRVPSWPVVMAVVTTFVSVAARVAILPVLALTLPHPPPLGPLSFASYALIFAQMLLPTPSGAGVVELGFLGGAVGNLGDEYKPLLLLWRLYSTFLPVVIGVGLGLWRYGPQAVEAIMAGKATPEVGPEERA